MSAIPASASCAHARHDRERLAASHRDRGIWRRFARKEEVGAETIDLGMAVENAIALMRPRLETGQVSLAVEKPLANSFVTIHGIRAEQIVVNLIGNAIDALKDSAAKAIRVRLEHEGHVAKLSVADSGAGIPEHPRAYWRAVRHHKTRGRRARPRPVHLRRDNQRRRRQAQLCRWRGWRSDLHREAAADLNGAAMGGGMTGGRVIFVDDEQTMRSAVE